MQNQVKKNSTKIDEIPKSQYCMPLFCIHIIHKYLARIPASVDLFSLVYTKHKLSDKKRLCDSRDSLKFACWQADLQPYSQPNLTLE